MFIIIICIVSGNNIAIGFVPKDTLNYISQHIAQ